MIPRTFPSTYLTANGKQQMSVYFLSSVDGLQRWKDYIPVRSSSEYTVKENSYDNDGVILIKDIGSTYGKQEWKDYIPVYLDLNATDAWEVDAVGFIPTFPTPGLSLDFTSSSETLDPRITFSRASNATRVNSDGLIEYAPHNLLTFSEQFDNAAWTKDQATVTANATVAPNGTTTADKLIVNNAQTAGYVFELISFTSGIAYTASCYVKAGEVSDFRFVFGAAAFGSNLNAIFNLSNGTVTSFTASSASIENVGNGWYRCVATATATATASTGVQFRSAHAGNGTNGIFIWGAQLNVGALQPYYPTTVKNLLGFSESFENAAWTKSNSYIQTNLLTWSEQVDNAAWLKSGATVTANTAVAPNGTTTADSLVEDNTSSGHRIAQAVVLNSTIAYTTSYYVKAEGRTWVRILIDDNGGSGANAYFNLSTGVVGTVAVLGTGASAAASIQNEGNGWYRCILSCVPSTSNSGNVRSFISGTTADNTGTYTGTASLVSVYIWGAQLVQGSTAGDYQQTTSAATPVMYKAPNGTMTADKLVENTAASEHVVYQAASYISGTPYTISVYAKASERTKVRLAFSNASAWSGGGGSAVIFDLIAETATPNNSTPTAYGITNVGNGWYRCFITGTPTSSFSGNAAVFLYTTLSYTGDGTSGILIWGAQLSDSASLDTYVATPGAAPTSTAYYGPRFTYDPVTKAPLGLLIEEQRTNLLLQSTAIDTAANWALGGGTLTANTTIAPDGTQTAETLTFPSGAATVTLYQVVSCSASTAYTFSFYVRLGTLPVTDFKFAIRDDSNGAFIAQDIVPTQTPTTTGWTRVVYTFTTPVGCVLVRPYLVRQGSTVGGTVFIWGAQLEAGAFATSYIPTTTASATRSADIATVTGSNFASWYRQDEGTLFAEFQRFYVAGGYFPRVFSLGNSGSNNELIEFVYSSPSEQFTLVSNNVGQGPIALADGGTAMNKLSGGYKINDVAASLNGGAVSTDTTSVVPVVSQMRIGDRQDAQRPFSGTIKRIAYYPTRLSNQQLQNLTS